MSQDRSCAGCHNTATVSSTLRSLLLEQTKEWIYISCLQQRLVRSDGFMPHLGTSSHKMVSSRSLRYVLTYTLGRITKSPRAESESAVPSIYDQDQSNTRRAASCLGDMNVSVASLAFLDLGVNNAKSTSERRLRTTESSILMRDSR